MPWMNLGISIIYQKPKEKIIIFVETSFINVVSVLSELIWLRGTTLVANLFRFKGPGEGATKLYVTKS